MIIYNGEINALTFKEQFGKTIEDIANNDKNVVYLDADLMNSSGTYGFWKRNPEQAINVGIAEANMMGIAGGLSAGGKYPYVHTFGPFASRRSYDQIFISIAYAGNSACIFGSDPGVCAAYNGGTHMPFEDVALMRAVPKSTVIEISDTVMMDKILRMVKNRKGLTYLRSSRKNYAKVYSEDQEFEIGKGIILRDGKDVTIIATGLMIHEAMKAAEKLAEEGIEARVVDMFTVKPVDSALVADSAKTTGAIVSAENHNIIGGLGDAVAAALFETNSLVPMERVGVKDEFGQVGQQDYLQQHYGLTDKEIYAAAKKAIANKQ